MTEVEDKSRKDVWDDNLQSMAKALDSRHDAISCIFKTNLATPKQRREQSKKQESKRSVQHIRVKKLQKFDNMY